MHAAGVRPYYVPVAEAGKSIRGWLRIRASTMDGEPPDVVLLRLWPFTPAKNANLHTIHSYLTAEVPLEPGSTRIAWQG